MSRRAWLLVKNLWTYTYKELIHNSFMKMSEICSRIFIIPISICIYSVLARHTRIRCIWFGGGHSYHHIQIACMKYWPKHVWLEHRWSCSQHLALCNHTASCLVALFLVQTRVNNSKVTKYLFHTAILRSIIFFCHHDSFWTDIFFFMQICNNEFCHNGLGELERITNTQTINIWF